MGVWRLRAVVAALGTTSWVLACGLFFPTVIEGEHGNDAAPDTADDVIADAGGIDDAPLGYHDLTSAQFWSTFDTTTVNASARGFSGGTFDGRYVYLAPMIAGEDLAGSTVTRFDTQGSFQAPASWSTFNTGSLDPHAGGYAGAVFDGRFVYMAPYLTTQPPAIPPSIVSRYDTLAQFTAKNSWSTVDTTTLNAFPVCTAYATADGGFTTGLCGFNGGVFDGRYVYFAANSTATFSPAASVLRYDTQAAFDAGNAWAAFDTTLLEPEGGAPIAFTGAVTDGRYVYFVPHADTTSAGSGLVVRYDAQSSFTSIASWSSFDTTVVGGGGDAGDAGVAGFRGGLFDGRYVYLVPTGSVVARYDTQASFTSTSAWSSYDTQISQGVTSFGGSVAGGGAFDGRYAYFVGANVVRCDTQTNFADPSSWSSFDTTPLLGDASPYTFQGAVFDGRYLYLVPYTANLDWMGWVVRFDAKRPSAMPALPSFFGSFY
jgi:hypothetical protein